MFSKSKRTAQKTVILAATAVLLLGTASALEWNNPSADGANLTGTVQINISQSDGSNLQAYYVDDGSWTEITSWSSPSDFNTHSWDTGGPGSGDYTLVANNSADMKNLSITIDNTNPSVDSFSPSDGGYTNKDEDLDVSYSASDDHTAVKYTNISIFSESESSTGTSLDNLDLDEDEYTVNYYVLDTVGNSNNGTWTFTVDTSYDGDTSPSLEWDAERSGDYIEMDDDVELTLTFNGDDEEPNEVTCYDGDTDDEDNEIDSDDSSSTNDNDDYEFTCDFDEDDYSGEEVELNLKMCDEAGNCETSDEGTRHFDATAPSISTVDIPGSIVNGDFPVEYSAADDTGIDFLEYFYSSDVDEGDGNPVNVDSREGEFTASVENIEEGDRTLYVRANDSVGQWSDTESIEFGYDKDAKPAINLTLPSTVSVTAGESTSFDIDLENTGNIFIDETNITVSGVASGSETVTDLEPGQSKTASFSVDTNGSDLGKHDTKVSLSYPKMQESFSLIVEANSDQQQNLESKLSNYQAKLESLEANVSSLKNSGLSEERKQRLELNVSEFRDKVETAEKALENENYYKISSALENVDQEYQSASSSYETVEKEHRNAQKMKWIMIGLGFFVVVIAGAGGFLYWSDEYEIDVDELVDSDINVRGFDDIMARIQTFIGSEEEAEEFEWDGFRDY